MNANKVGPTHLFQIASCFLAFPTFWNVASVRESESTAQMIWWYSEVKVSRNGPERCSGERIIAGTACCLEFQVR